MLLIICDLREPRRGEGLVFLTDVIFFYVTEVTQNDKRTFIPQFCSTNLVTIRKVKLQYVLEPTDSAKNPVQLPYAQGINMLRLDFIPWNEK
jgi:hypothetical protein